jgi:tetratricopeptide (TPR) repeat protein
MPDVLREKAWTQIGNVSFRLVQGQIEKEPDAALSRLQQSREAYRIALAFNKGNKTAVQNLSVVEAELAKVYSRLAKQLTDEAKKDTDVPRAVEKLDAALSYAQQSLSLAPKEKEQQEQKKDIEKTLAGKLDQRAALDEAVADRSNLNLPTQRTEAQERLQNALTDFQRAQTLDKQDQVAKDGEKRVQDKLANLFNKAGRQDQSVAQRQIRNQPAQAIENLEKALENFQNSLALAPEHQDSQAGEKEVKAQLEQLRLAQGDRQMQQGERQLQSNPEMAAQNLENALENFETAKALNPQNPTIQPRIDQVQAMLPNVLAQLAQQQLQQAEAQEQNQNNQQALENFQQAEANFAEAQEMMQGQQQQQAQQGQQQAQAGIDRLQQAMAQQQGQGQKPGQQPGQQQSQSEIAGFQSMLAKLKQEMKNDEVRAQHSAGQKYTEQRERSLHNW